MRTAPADDVVITGIGLFTPAGDGAEATWERVCKGWPTAVGPAEVPGLEAALGQEGPAARPSRHPVCPAPPIAPDRIRAARSRKPDRCAQMALLAAAEAVVDAGFRLDESLSADWDGARVAVVAGTATGGPATYDREFRSLRTGGPEDMSPFAVPSSLSNSVAGQLTMALGAHGPSLAVSTACAAGATAVTTAADLLRLGRCDVAVAVGAESGLTPFYLAGFDRLGALSRRFDDPAAASRPFDRYRDGFVMGEGAGALVLERAGDAGARGGPVRARLLGQGASSDAHHPVRPRGDGQGLATALRAALTEAALAPEDVGHVNAHATGTPVGDAVEASVLARFLPHMPAVTSTKGVTGHLLGAAGAVEAALTVLALQRRAAPPNANLETPSPGIELNLPTVVVPVPGDAAVSVSTGFGGHNTVLVLARA